MNYQHLLSSICDWKISSAKCFDHDDVIKWNHFRVTGPLCGDLTGPGEFPAQRPVTRSFDVFFDLRLNKRMSKQSWGWWFETLPWSLWRQCNVLICWLCPSLLDDAWVVWCYCIDNDLDRRGKQASSFGILPEVLTTKVCACSMGAILRSRTQNHIPVFQILKLARCWTVYFVVATNAAQRCLPKNKLLLVDNGVTLQKF